MRCGNESIARSKYVTTTTRCDGSKLYHTRKYLCQVEKIICITSKNSFRLDKNRSRRIDDFSARPSCYFRCEWIGYWRVYHAHFAFIQRSPLCSDRALFVRQVIALPAKTFITSAESPGFDQAADESHSAQIPNLRACAKPHKNPYFSLALLRLSLSIAPPCCQNFVSRYVRSTYR